MSLSPKERLLRLLKHQGVDRPPVICTGGMINAAIVERVAAQHPDTPVIGNLTGPAANCFCSVTNSE